MQRLSASPMRVSARAEGAASSAAHAAAAPAPASSPPSSNLRVVVRVRPLLRHEAGEEAVLRATPDGRTVHAVMSRSGDRQTETLRRFTFDGVAGPSTAQTAFFDLSGIASLIDDALRGVNVSVFAYGQTGSGKTYSMSGHEERMQGAAFTGRDAAAGLVPRALAHLFDRIGAEAEAAAAGEPAPSTVVRASMVEIFNEGVYDLLNVTGESLPLRLQPAAAAGAGRGGGGPGSFYVQGQVVVTCDTPEDVSAVLAEGHKNRSVSSHALNADSSRSHSVLTVTLERRVPDPDRGADADADADADTVVRSKILFVDLAGSERLKDSKSEGATAAESRAINTSLLALGKVIAALADAAPPLPPPRGAAHSSPDHIPYRDSKLTKLLADSLGGSARTLMVACVSPAAAFLDESLLTLGYALRASRIRNSVVVHVDAREEGRAAKRQAASLRAENDALRRENSLLRRALELPAEGGVDQDLVSQSLDSLREAAVEAARARLEAAAAAHAAAVAATASAAAGAAGAAGGGVGGLGGPRPLLPYSRGRAPASKAAGAADGASGARAASGGPVRHGRARASGGGGGGGGGGGRNASAGHRSASVGSSGASVSAVGPVDPATGLVQPAPAHAPPPPFNSRVAERVAERSGSKLVLDVQQAELDALGAERDGLVVKLRAAKARSAALLTLVESQKGAVEKLGRELEAAKKAKQETERGMAALLTRGIGDRDPAPAAAAAAANARQREQDAEEINELRMEVADLQEANATLEARLADAYGRDGRGRDAYGGGGDGGDESGW
jgi:hypothetical protein